MHNVLFVNYASTPQTLTLRESGQRFTVAPEGSIWTREYLGGQYGEFSCTVEKSGSSTMINYRGKDLARRIKDDSVLLIELH